MKKLKIVKLGIGYDALNEEYVNMIKAGIVDPTKVTRSALQNAASVASTFLTTEAAVADIPAKEPPMPGDQEWEWTECIKTIKIIKLNLIRR